MKASQYFILLFWIIAGHAYGQTKEVTVNGVVIHYTDQGTGLPVVFIHGALEDYRVWQPIVENFSKNFRTITYSRRLNYPNTNDPDPENYSQDTDADDLAEIFKALDIPAAHIVGHSFGGLSAISFAKKYPHLVRSIVLSEPPVYEWLKDMPEGEEQYAKFYNELWRPVQIAFDLRDTADVLRHTFNYFYGENLISQLPPDVKTMILANFPEWKALANSKTAFRGISREDVKNIKVPVMLIGAGNTFPAMKLTNAELQRLLPDAKQYYVAEGTHDYWFSQPDVIGSQVLSFIQSCPAK